jgi:hypothetical protein
MVLGAAAGCTIKFHMLGALPGGFSQTSGPASHQPLVTFELWRFFCRTQIKSSPVTITDLLARRSLPCVVLVFAARRFAGGQRAIPAVSACNTRASNQRCVSGADHAF